MNNHSRDSAERRTSAHNPPIPEPHRSTRRRPVRDLESSPSRQLWRVGGGDALVRVAVQFEDEHEPAFGEERSVERAVHSREVAQRPPGLASCVDLSRSSDDLLRPAADHGHAKESSCHIWHLVLTWTSCATRPKNCCTPPRPSRPTPWLARTRIGPAHARIGSASDRAGLRIYRLASACARGQAS